MKKLFTFALLAAVALTGCSKYDDSELRRLLEEQRKELEEHDGRLAALETLTKALGDRLDAGAMIASVSELPDGAGWRIAFTKGDPIEIRHGAKGADGKDGNNGNNGNNGDKGTAPHIGPDGNWWVGTTNTGVKAVGDTPEIIGGYWWIGGENTGIKAIGDDGDSLLSDIVYNSNGTATIHLTNGRSFTFPLDPSSAAGKFGVEADDTDWVSYVWSGAMEYKGENLYPNGATLDRIYVTLKDVAGKDVISLYFLLPSGNNRLVAGTYFLSTTPVPNTLYWDGGFDTSMAATDAFYNRGPITDGKAEVSVEGTGDTAVYTIDLNCKVYGGGSVSLVGTYVGKLATI